MTTIDPVSPSDSASPSNEFALPALNIPTPKEDSKVQQAVAEALADLSKAQSENKPLIATDETNSNPYLYSDDQAIIVEIHQSVEDEILTPLLQSQNSSEAGERKGYKENWDRIENLSKRIGKGKFIFLYEDQFVGPGSIKSHYIKKLTSSVRTSSRSVDPYLKKIMDGVIPVLFDSGRLFIQGKPIGKVIAIKETIFLLCMDRSNKIYLHTDSLQDVPHIEDLVVIDPIFCTEVTFDENSQLITLANTCELESFAGKKFYSVLKEHKADRLIASNSIHEELEGWNIRRDIEGVIKTIELQTTDSRNQHFIFLKKLKSKGVSLKNVNIVFKNVLFNTTRTADDYYNRLKNESENL